MIEALKDHLNDRVTGQEEAVELVLIALLAGGHILLEGVPGIGKTRLAKSLAAALDVSAARIQFTPDMLPSDVLGSVLYDMREGIFRVERGPVFANIVLVDEINRTPPKTQAAMLEAMEEGQVTLYGQTLHLPQPFFVVATQNPVEYEGTYPLPEAQLDRFLMKITMSYPDPQAERDMLSSFEPAHIARMAASKEAAPPPAGGGGRPRQGGAALDGWRSDQGGPALTDAGRPQVAVPPLDDDGRKHADDISGETQSARGDDRLLEAQRLTARVEAAPAVIAYIAAIAAATRELPTVALGASPRGATALLMAARASAHMDGRTFVTPDDVKRVAVPVLAHRIIVTPGAQLEGVTAHRVVEDVLASIAVPR